MWHEEAELLPEMEEQKKLVKELRKRKLTTKKKPSTKQQRTKEVLTAAKFLHWPMWREEIAFLPETEKQNKLLRKELKR